MDPRGAESGAAARRRSGARARSASSPAPARARRPRSRGGSRGRSRPGAFAPDQILAVTFTDKAAGEMRARLARLGADGVEARTFHSAALAQLRHGARRRPGADPLDQGAAAAPDRQHAAARRTASGPAGDLATEVEWAKNRRLTPQTYRDGLERPRAADPGRPDGDGLPRVRAAQGGLGRDRLRGPARARRCGCTRRTRTRSPRSASATRAFTVDEYQDVNLLQQSLLELWLGPRDDLCAVGDDYQSIYGFTGASPEWLLGLATRFPQATVVRLEENYRSSPQVLALANRLVPRLGGAEKTLRATRPDGPEPELRGFDSPEAEGAFVARARPRARTPRAWPTRRWRC